MKDGQAPRPPEAWNTARPSEDEINKFKASEADRLAKAAAEAKDFQAQFPKDSRIAQARDKEYELLQIASRLGNTNVLPRLEVVEAAKLKDPSLPEDERFQIRATAVNRKAMAKLPEGLSVALAELDAGAHSLLKEFPKRPEPYQMLMEVATESDPDRAVKLAKEVRDSSAPEQLKQLAQDLLKKMDRIGKPLSLKFAATDGRQVDLAKLKGKVVLIDFWATWCGPCVHEVPNVRAAYERLHPKGFEIVGISFDKEKDSLQSFIKEQKMTWPQYFDGKYWDNDFGKEFGIQSIPTMWLVDKKGNLRDLNAREDLTTKVDKLLAENP